MINAPVMSLQTFPSTFCLQILKSIPGLEGHWGNPHADYLVHFIGGGLAGMTAATATYPLDLVRTRLAAQVIHYYILKLRALC